MPTPEGVGRRMGFDFGLQSPDLCLIKKNRWLLRIPDVSADGINSLPPSKASRPGISFKTMEAQHVTETVSFPGKPEWKPITLTLYEPKVIDQPHPVIEWLKLVYDVQNGSTYKPSCDGFKKSQAILEMFDGCGFAVETWVFESIWPQNIEFGELDMQISDVVTCDLTLVYDRAYVE